MRFAKQHTAVCVLLAFLLVGRLIATPVELLNVSNQNPTQHATGDLRVANSANETDRVYYETGDMGYHTAKDVSYFEVGNEGYATEADYNNPDASEVLSPYKVLVRAEEKDHLTGVLIIIFSVVFSISICCAICLRCGNSCIMVFRLSARGREVSEHNTLPLVGNISDPAD